MKSPAPSASSPPRQRAKRRVLVAHACRNGPCRYFVQTLIFSFLLCALGLMAYSLHLRLYSTRLASASAQPHSADATPVQTDTEATRALLAVMHASASTPVPTLLAPLADVSNRSLLLFSVLPDLSPDYAAASAANYARYTAALTSWLSLSTLASAAVAASSESSAQSEWSVARLDVAVFVDSAASCDHVKATYGDAVHCVVSSSLVDALGQADGCVRALSHGSRPYMHCVWQYVANHSTSGSRQYDDILYVNGDILLFPSLLDTLTVVHRTFPASNSSYTLITQRRDAAIAALAPSALSPQQLLRTQQLFAPNASSGGEAAVQLHDSYGIDCFLLSSALFYSVAPRFPALLVGSHRWDNWLLASLLRDSNSQRPVIDGTHGWVVGHDSAVAARASDDGGKWNEVVVKRSMGKWWRVGSVDNADVRVVASSGAGNGSSVGGLKLEVNGAEREQVQLYRYVTARQSRAQQSTGGENLSP